MTFIESRHQNCVAPQLPGITSPGHGGAPSIDEAFCLRLTVAMLYRAGLDAMDDGSSLAGEAHEFLESDFALLALQVLQSPEARDIDWGDVSDYVGHIQRVHRKRYGTYLFPANTTDDQD